MDNFISYMIGLILGLFAALLFVSFVDYDFEAVLNKLNTIESVCREANSYPKSYDEFTVTCNNGGKFSYE